MLINLEAYLNGFHNYKFLLKKSSVALVISNIITQRNYIFKLVNFSKPFANWIDASREDLVDIFIVHTIEEIQVQYAIK